MPRSEVGGWCNEWAAVLDESLVVKPDFLGGVGRDMMRSQRATALVSSAWEQRHLFMVYCLVHLLQLGLGLLCLVIGWRRPRWALGLAGLLLGALVAYAVLMYRPVWEAWLFPSVDYLLWRPFWLYLLSAAFFGLAISRLPVRWNRWVVTVVAVLVAAHGAWSNRWVLLPEEHGDARTADLQHHCRQSTMYTCAPASCVIAASYCGIAVSERQMAERCLTSSAGTQVFNIYRGLRLTLPSERFRVAIEAVTAEDLCQPGRLAIVAWVEMAHAICVVGDGDGVVVHDPLVSRPGYWDRARLAERFDGVAVRVDDRRSPDRFRPRSGP